MVIDFLSKDVQEYMQQRGLLFSDFEKAALISHSYQPFLKKIELLERLAEETKDEPLKKQLLEHLTCDRQDLDAFRDNTEGYIYATEWRRGRDHNICGYFATADMAYAHGMTLEREFKIEKHLIIGFRGQKPKDIKDYFNPYISGADIWDCVNEYDGIGYPVAEAWYSQNGILELFFSYEIDRSDEEVIARHFDPARFENAFIRVPNIFQRGDIVKIVNREGHGIVSTSQREWQELLERVEAGKQGYADFQNATVNVDFLEGDGSISPKCICPVFLERYEPKEGDDRELLLAARAVAQDNGSFVDFARRYDDYKKRKGEGRTWVLLEHL